MLLLFLVCPRILSSLGKKIFKSYESGLAAKRVKPEKYEALNKAAMKWLQILRSEPITKLGIEEARKAIQILEDFSLFSQFGEAMLKSLKEIDCNIDKDELCNKKQTVIFFQSNWRCVRGR